MRAISSSSANSEAGLISCRSRACDHSEKALADTTVLPKNDQLKPHSSAGAVTAGQLLALLWCVFTFAEVSEPSKSVQESRILLILPEFLVLGRSRPHRFSRQDE